MIRRQLTRRQMLLAGMAGLGSLVAARDLRGNPSSGAAAAAAGVACTRLGATDHSGRLRIEGKRGEAIVDLAMDQIQRAWSGALPGLLG